MLEFFDAAHHTRPNPQDSTHRPRTYPIQLSFRQRSIGHALGIDTPSGGEFFHAAPHVLHRCSLYRDRSTNLRIRAWDQWRENRMHVGCGAWRFFSLWRLFPFLLAWSLFPSAEKQSHAEEGDLRGRWSMRGRVWTGVAIDGRIVLGGWEESRSLIFYLYYYLYCLLVEHREVERVREWKVFPALSCVGDRLLSVALILAFRFIACHSLYIVSPYIVFSSSKSKKTRGRSHFHTLSVLWLVRMSTSATSVRAHPAPCAAIELLFATV